MNVTDLLRTDAKVISAVGSGGKSTLLEELAHELPGQSILATTTHMLVPENVPYLEDPSGDDVVSALEAAHAICIGKRVPGTEGKISAPSLPAETLREFADHLLIEADGSKRLPLKAHAAWEPVVPVCTDETILLVGASGFGRPIEETVHRPEIFCALAGAGPEDAAAPELVACAIASEYDAGICRPDLIVVNQAEGRERQHQAARLAAELAARRMQLPVFAGSIRTHDLFRIA